MWAASHTCNISMFFPEGDRTTRNSLNGDFAGAGPDVLRPSSWKFSGVLIVALAPQEHYRPKLCLVGKLACLSRRLTPKKTIFQSIR